MLSSGALNVKLAMRRPSSPFLLFVFLCQGFWFLFMFLTPSVLELVLHTQNKDSQPPVQWNAIKPVDSDGTRVMWSLQYAIHSQTRSSPHLNQSTLAPALASESRYA